MAEDSNKAVKQIAEAVFMVKLGRGNYEPPSAVSFERINIGFLSLFWALLFRPCHETSAGTLEVRKPKRRLPA